MKTTIKKICLIIKEKVLSILFYSFWIFKVDNNKIIFSSMNGKGYGENPKYICQKILCLKLDCKLFWAVKEYDETMPSNIIQVKIYSIKWFFHMATAKIWVNDSRFPSYVKKRRTQYYIQTWHSSLRLKKIEGDVVCQLPYSYIRMAKHDSKMIDLITCGSNFSKETYENSFWYDGPILMSGTPKFDIYFLKNKETIVKSIYHKYNIGFEKKSILYAPTFRSNKKKFAGCIDFNILSENSDFENYIFLIRLHPEAQTKIESKNNLINVTNYPNFQDLLISSDLLITDYSGCCFDALIAKKPCILYVPDFDEYISKERNLYFEYSELPFPIVKNMDELQDKIINFNYDKYIKDIDSFSVKVGLNENGNSSEIIVNRIKEVLKNDKKI